MEYIKDHLKVIAIVVVDEVGKCILEYLLPNNLLPTSDQCY